MHTPGLACRWDRPVAIITTCYNIICSSLSTSKSSPVRKTIPIPKCESKQRIELIIPLLEPTKSRTQIRSMSQHFLESCHFPMRRENRRDCVMCSNRKGGERRLTYYTCDKCPDMPALCVEPCFKNYHMNRPSLYHC